MIALLLFIVTIPLHFPQTDEASRVLDQSLQALGGIERLRALNSLYFKGKGSEFRSADLQGLDPSTPVKTFHEELIAAFPLPNSKTVLELFFAADTHLLSKYEYTMDFPGLGDTVVEFVYNGYRSDAKLGHVPTGYKILLNGKPYREIDFMEVEADSPKAAAAFELTPQMKSYLMPPG